MLVNPNTITCRDVHGDSVTVFISNSVFDSITINWVLTFTGDLPCPMNRDVIVG